MAITITTSLDANVAAYAPVTLAGTTTRNPFSSGVRQSGALTAMADSGGVLRITTSDSFTGWSVGDTIIISGASGDFAQYNGRHTIGTLTASYINTTTTWVAATTGDKGNVYRMNENLTIKCNVINDSAEVIATLYNLVNTADGSWTFDLQKPLQHELGSIFDLTPGEVSTALASHEYTFALYETWQAADFTVTESVSGGTPTTIAHRTADLKTEFVNGSKLLTGNFYHDGLILIHFIMNAGGADIQLKFSEQDGTVTNTGALTETNWHYAYVFASTDTWVKVAAWDVTEGTRISDDIYIHKIGCASTILYYLNRWGGYEAYEFHNWEDDQNANKVEQYTGEAWDVRTLQGKEYSKSANINVRDIVTSPEVYDEDFVSVRVTSNSINYRADEVTPKVTVRYDENFIQ